jgi:hypothetical protein
MEQSPSWEANSSAGSREITAFCGTQSCSAVYTRTSHLCLCDHIGHVVRVYVIVFSTWSVFMRSHWPRDKCSCDHIGHVASVYVVAFATRSMFVWSYLPRDQCLCDHTGHVGSVYVIVFATWSVFMWSYLPRGQFIWSHLPRGQCLCDHIGHVTSVYEHIVHATQCLCDSICHVASVYVNILTTWSCVTGCHIIHALTHSLFSRFLSVDHARHLQQCTQLGFGPACCLCGRFQNLETTIEIACMKKLRADEI